MLASLWFFTRVITQLPGSEFITNNAAGTTIVVAAPAGVDTMTEEDFVINGVGDRGTRLNILVNDEVVGQTWVGADDTWSFTLTLAPGSYNVKTQATRRSALGTAVTAQNLILVIASLLLAVLFTFIFRVTNGLVRRLFLPGMAQPDTAISDYDRSIGYLPNPVQLAELFLRIVQSNVGTDDAWFFVTENGPGGSLLLRPLTSVGTDLDESISFANSSPMTAYFRQNNRPLSQHDIDTLDIFADITAENREKLTAWQRILYIPLRAGQHLVGIVALGAKSSGEAYDRKDNDMLQRFSEQFSPLLAQAQNLASLQAVNDYVYQENQSLVREQRHLKELVSLYNQFVGLVSPDLRRPFSDINQKLQTLRESTNDGNIHAKVDAITDEVEAVKVPIDNLITLSSRILVRNQFDFALVDMEDVAQNAMRKLTTMADARRVGLEFNAQTALPAVYGDAEQLQEAVQYLLHNAIKFNKIGGVVQLHCGVEGSNLYLRVIDTGVGIPEDRLDSIWDGLTVVSKNGDRRGTGLGLPLTRFIIAAHGGYVETESKYGSGSVFAFYLPLVFDEEEK
jgi:signal transduction histidine kinase